MVQFHLKNHEEHVVLNGALLPLAQVMADQREKKPDSQICYHTMQVDTADPKKFELTPSHKVAFVAKEEDKELSCNSIACKEEVRWELSMISLSVSV